MTAPLRHPKTESLTFRISPEDKALLESAIAHTSGLDLTSFILPPALKRAREIMKRDEVTMLNDQARERFIALIEYPVPPSDRFLHNLADERHQIVE